MLSRARRLMPLVKEGFASSLTEAATRSAFGHPAIRTILVGLASPQQFEDAPAAGRPRPSSVCRRYGKGSPASHDDSLRLPGRQPCLLMSAFGGKADIDWTSARVAR